MSPRHWLLCLIVLSASARLVDAGMPRRPAPKRPTSAPYVPRVQEYVVVEPTNTHANPHDDILWEQQRPKAPMYPYGWFGAKSFSQRGTHLRYYGETVDFNTRRGY